jgi:HEAT repeat protein
VSTARTVLTFAAALVVLPLAMKARESASAVNASIVPVVRVSNEKQERDQVTAAELRAYFDGIRGANPVLCEIVLSSFNSWSSSRAPDRDSVSWNVGMVVHRRVASEQLIPDLVTQMRSTDPCVSRVAARLLGRSNVESAKTALLTALRDDNAQVRQLAAIGIGFSEDSTATRPLVRALGDRDDRVRAAVAWALGAVHN